MPELAEVEFYRKQWNPGLGQRVVRVQVHGTTRVFRGTSAVKLARALRGLKYDQSWARGKQMLFRFGREAWIGLHLGMTGKLLAEKPPFQPTKHDHLVIILQKMTLVFRDARQFGRVRFHCGKTPPAWWTEIGPSPCDKTFSRDILAQFLARHRKLPIKAALLLQAGFPGIGNWMADEILWQAGIRPTRETATLSATELTTVWKHMRAICRVAMRTIAEDFSDPPPDWLFHERWSRKGLCPRHRTPLDCATVGGRTTVWCPKCQPL
jgi:formamidopyrimidine-DNA glycosylase